MKKKNLIPLLGIAFIVAVVSTGIFYGLFVGRLSSAVPAGIGSTQLVLAAKDIKAGDIVAAEDLKRVPWLVSGVPPGSMTEISEAANKVALRPIPANDLVRLSDLGTESGGSTESGSLGIPQGMRAVSLQAQDSAGVISVLKPGHRVDVQVISNQPGPKGPEPFLKTILENVLVLALPRNMPGVPAAVQIVTVLATPEQSAMLGLADSAAKVRLALRNPIDKKFQARNPALGLGSLFTDAGVK